MKVGSFMFKSNKYTTKSIFENIVLAAIINKINNYSLIINPYLKNNDFLLNELVIWNLTALISIISTVLINLLNTQKVKVFCFIP